MCVMLHVHLPLIKINAFWQNLYYSTQRIWFNKTSMIKILIFFHIWINKEKIQKWKNDIHVHCTLVLLLAEYSFNSTQKCFSLVLNQSWDCLKRVILDILTFILHPFSIYSKPLYIMQLIIKQFVFHLYGRKIAGKSLHVL